MTSKTKLSRQTAMSTKTTTSPQQSLGTIADHLAELRTRLTWVAVVFILLSSLAYSVKDQLVSFVLSPLGDQKLVYLTPAGGFSFIFLITLYAGALLTAPVALYHVYRYISPAMPPRKRQHTGWIIAASTALMVVGAGFGYLVAIPAALTFLTTFAGGFVQPNLTADSYLNFVVAYVIGLGLMFQLPLLLILINWARPFARGELLRSQQYVFVGSFIAAAIITPTPDIINQCLIALPIVIAYQLGVLVVYITNKRAKPVTPSPPVARTISHDDVVHRHPAVRRQVAEAHPAAIVQPKQATRTHRQVPRTAASMDGLRPINRQQTRAIVRISSPVQHGDGQPIRPARQ